MSNTRDYEAGTQGRPVQVPVDAKITGEVHRVR